MASETKREAARDASKLLDQVWTSGIPVDPVLVARAAGLRVLEDSSLDSSIMGALVVAPNQDPTILLNENDGSNRKRFTCAHEIGHFVRRGSRAASGPMTTIDFRNGESSGGTNDDEIYANEFAACLLMPEDDVRRLAKEFQELELSIRFGVSVEAMHFRLKNLGLA